MPLWTNGPAYVVATGWGVARCDDGKPQVTRWSTEKLKKDQEPPKLDVFAILDDEGRQAIVRREDEPCQLWTAGEGFEPLDGFEILDAVSLGGGAVLAAIGEGDRATLRRAKLEKKKLTLGETIALPAANKASWSSTIWDKGEETWPEGDEDREGEAPFDQTAVSLRSKANGSWLGRVRLEANRCGIAMTSTYSGVTALFDPKSLAAKPCVRVPTELEQLDLFGLPVPHGLLLTIVKETQNTEFVLIGPGGEIVTAKNKLGKETAGGSHSPGLLWADDKVLVNQNAGGAALYFLALPGLAPKQFGKDEVNVVAAASTPDGSKHVVATSSPEDRKLSSWKLLRYDPNAKKVKGEALTMPDFKPPPPPIAKPEKRKRAEGSPVLAMRPDAATPWRANVSESAALKLQVMNRGGPLSGMYVELAGNAVSDALVAGEDATLGGAKARFEKKGTAFRAEISDAHLDAHFADASRADPAPSIELVVRLKAQRAGNALMTVRVGPLGATGITGSAMEGRSFVVAG